MQLLNSTSLCLAHVLDAHIREGAALKDEHMIETGVEDADDAGEQGQKEG